MMDYMQNYISNTIMFKKILILISLISSYTISIADVIDIYAHRGQRALSPENTLPSYTQSMRVGVDVIDMDINMTKDKVLVVTHDLTLNPDLTKDSNGKWITKKTPIKDLTLAELQ